MKRKQQKRKDPVEALIGKISEKAQVEMNSLLNSLESHIEELFFPIRKQKESMPKKENPFNTSKSFTIKAEPQSEKERFEKAKDITPKKQ
ncbi:MAG: hypothetical protein KA146_06180 [Leptospiraceae bacterium]|nr:hypothetical protein [Leptospiraceae bacterium]